jgi:hypothetical protein
MPAHVLHVMELLINRVNLAASHCMQHEQLHLQSGLGYGSPEAAAKLQAQAPYHIGPLLVCRICSKRLGSMHHALL